MKGQASLSESEACRQTVFFFYIWSEIDVTRYHRCASSERASTPLLPMIPKRGSTTD